jgi:hypothetical protein
LNPARRIFNCAQSLKRRSYRYFSDPLETWHGWYSIYSDAALEIDMRELSAEARLHLHARSLSPRRGAGIQTAALYGALAVIAGVVFGTLSVHPF